MLVKVIHLDFDEGPNFHHVSVFFSICTCKATDSIKVNHALDLGCGLQFFGKPNVEKNANGLFLKTPISASLFVKYKLAVNENQGFGLTALYIPTVLRFETLGISNVSNVREGFTTKTNHILFGSFSMQGEAWTKFKLFKRGFELGIGLSVNTYNIDNERLTKHVFLSNLGHQRLLYQMLIRPSGSEGIDRVYIGRVIRLSYYGKDSSNSPWALNLHYSWQRKAIADVSYRVYLSEPSQGYFSWYVNSLGLSLSRQILGRRT